MQRIENQCILTLGPVWGELRHDLMRGGEPGGASGGRNGGIPAAALPAAGKTPHRQNTSRRSSSETTP